MRNSNGVIRSYGAGRLFRPVLLLLAVALIAGIVGAGVAEARRKKPKVGSRQSELSAEVNSLARQLPGLPLDESGKITGHIQKLILAHMEKWLNHRTATGIPDLVEVRHQIESSFSKLRYPLTGRGVVFIQPWNNSTLIGTGYTLGWSNYDRVNVVALFQTVKGATHLAAVSHFVPRTDLHYTPLPSAGQNAFRFFAFGTRLGKSQPRLTVFLYAFDGKTLKPLWEIHDVYDGAMSINGNQVAIRYLKESEYIRAIQRGHNPPRYEAIYKITPHGLTLQDEHQIPF